MDISILIASWNTREFLRKCLESIQSTDRGLEIETIVIENASSDGSLEMLRDEFPWVEVIPCQKNMGFGRANNEGAKIAQGRYLLLLNPDAFLHPGAVQALFSYLQTDERVGAVGPKILNPDGTQQISISPTPTLAREAWRLLHLDILYPLSKYPADILTSSVSRPVDVLLGACMMIRKSIIEQIGLFDEQFFMYSEEVDLCKRIQEAGWRIDWLPTALATHYGGQSTRQVADVMFLELYRNKVRFFRKHKGNLYTSIYKGLLYMTALTRWLPGSIFGSFPFGRRAGWLIISRQYRCLLSELPGL